MATKSATMTTNNKYYDFSREELEEMISEIKAKPYPAKDADRVISEMKAEIERMNKHPWTSDEENEARCNEMFAEEFY